MDKSNTSSLRADDYMNMPNERRLVLAGQMAKELFEQHGRLYSLVTAIRNQLAPVDGECDDIIGFNLAEILEQKMEDVTLFYRLQDCIEAMKQSEEVAA